MKSIIPPAGRPHPHFGFGPAEFRDLSTRPVSDGKPAKPGDGSSGRGAFQFDDFDLNDYRHFELRR